MSNPFDFLAVPANALVSGISGFLSIPVALAIVLATIVVRLVLLPAGYAQHRADQRRNAILGKITALKERHVNSPKRLEAELTDLYKAEGGSLARGCLPLLVQMPVFAALYQLFVSPTVAGKTNLLLHQTMFGVPLGAHVADAPGTQLLVFAGLILLLVAIGYVSSKLLAPQGAKPHPLVRVVPYLTAAFALFMPLAASLYLVTSTAWTLAQTVALRQWAG